MFIHLLCPVCFIHLLLMVFIDVSVVCCHVWRLFLFSIGLFDGFLTFVLVVEGSFRLASESIRLVSGLLGVRLYYCVVSLGMYCAAIDIWKSYTHIISAGLPACFVDCLGLCLVCSIGFSFEVPL